MSIRSGSLRLLRVALALACFASIPGAPAALAHPTSSFTACAAFYRLGTTCREDGTTYEYGRTVFLRAKVNPPHAGYRAVVLRKKPYSDTWHRFGGAIVSDHGKIRFEWRTAYHDAVQNKPYWFKFKIPNHGASNAVSVWVIFGE
jgi:hypothetical protein